MRMMGIDGQRFFASGDGPFSPLQRDQVLAEMDMLDSAGSQCLPVGTHDTSDEMSQTFSKRFGQRFQQVEAGRAIRIGSNQVPTADKVTTPQ